MADGGGKVGGRSFVCARSVLFVCAVFCLFAQCFVCLRSVLFVCACAVFCLFARVQCFVCLRVDAVSFARSRLCALVIGQRTANDYVQPNTAGHDPR